MIADEAKALAEIISFVMDNAVVTMSWLLSAPILWGLSRGLLVNPKKIEGKFSDAPCGQECLVSPLAENFHKYVSRILLQVIVLYFLVGLITLIMTFLEHVATNIRPYTDIFTTLAGGVILIFGLYSNVRNANDILKN